jgi:hypothetical protein
MSSTYAEVQGSATNLLSGIYFSRLSWTTMLHLGSSFIFAFARSMAQDDPIPGTARATPAGYAYHALNRGNHRSQVFHDDAETLRPSLTCRHKPRSRFPAP